MKHLVQRVSFLIYRLVNGLGLLRFKPFSYLFNKAYDFYKRKIEDPFYALTVRNPVLFQRGDLIDVGANIGYTVEVFSAAVPKHFKIHAMEPEQDNFRKLEARVSDLGLNNVTCLKIAVGDTSGSTIIYKNPHHPADHRVYAVPSANLIKGEVISVTTLDEYCRQKNISKVGFVKIDVQGYESKVLAGMKDLLAQNQSVSVAFEVHIPSLLEAGNRFEDLLNAFSSDFEFYLISKNGELKKLLRDQIFNEAQKANYINVLATRDVNANF